MSASLPMYDRPETRGATDRFWQAIATRLMREGIDAPPRLTRGVDPWTLWTDPALVLSQTCSLPYRARLSGTVRLVAAPDYGLPGCGPGQYNSVILARPGPLPDRPRPAVNDALSQSGWAALAAWAEEAGLPLAPPHVTGSHAASVRAVASGAADIAAIDAHSWRLLLRHDGDPGLAELARTPPSPCLPFITAAWRDPAPLFAALAGALDALSPEDRRALALSAILPAREADYLSLPMPPSL